MSSSQAPVDAPETPAANPRSKPQMALRDKVTYTVLVLLVGVMLFGYLWKSQKPPLVAKVFKYGDQHVLVLSTPNGSAVYGVWARIIRPGQPDRTLYRTKVEFPYRYIMGTPVDPANPDGRITPVFVQAGDQIRITANTYYAPILLRFNELALDQPTLSYKWEVRFGVLNDDILLTNTSQVPLTNVVFRPRIEANGQVWEPLLKIDRLDPGSVCTWGNIVSIPGSQFDRSSSTLACDQSPSVPNSSK